MIHTITCQACFGTGSVLGYVEVSTGAYIEGTCWNCDGYGVDYADTDSDPDDYNDRMRDFRDMDDFATYFTHPHHY